MEDSCAIDVTNVMESKNSESRLAINEAAPREIPYCRQLLGLLSTRLISLLYHEFQTIGCGIVYVLRILS